MASLLEQNILALSPLISDRKPPRGAIIERSYKVSDNLSKLGHCIVQTAVRNKGDFCNNVLSVSNKHGFISQNEQFEDRVVASDDTSNYKIVGENDFAYNPARINVGSIARYKKQELGIVSPMYICFSTNAKLVPCYLEFYFNTKYFYTELNRRLEGSVRQCLTFNGLCDISIPICTIENQKKISDRLQLLTDKISTEEKYLNVLKKQRIYLLSQMFI